MMLAYTRPRGFDNSMRSGLGSAPVATWAMSGAKELAPEAEAGEAPVLTPVGGEAADPKGEEAVPTRA